MQGRPAGEARHYLERGWQELRLRSFRGMELPLDGESGKDPRQAWRGVPDNRERSHYPKTLISNTNAKSLDKRYRWNTLYEPHFLLGYAGKFERRERFQQWDGYRNDLREYLWRTFAGCGFRDCKQLQD